MKSIIFLGMFAAMVHLSHGENCYVDPYYTDFDCIDLTDESGPYVKTRLTEIPPGYGFRVRFVNSSVSGLPRDLFDGYLVTEFHCDRCDVGPLPIAMMSSFGNEIYSIELKSSNVTNIRSGFLQSLPFKDSMYVVAVIGCRISKIEKHAFSGPSVLDSMQFDECKIGEIEDFAFSNMSNIQYLELAYSEMPPIALNTIKSLPMLTMLDFTYTGMQTLEDGTVNDDDFPKLDTLFIWGNPWYCNCSLQWIKTYMNVHPLLFTGKEPFCREPEIARFSDVDFCNW